MKKIINLKIIKAYSFEHFFCLTLKIKKIIKQKKYSIITIHNTFIFHNTDTTSFTIIHIVKSLSFNNTNTTFYLQKLSFKLFITPPSINFPFSEFISIITPSSSIFVFSSLDSIISPHPFINFSLFETLKLFIISFMIFLESFYHCLNRV